MLRVNLSHTSQALPLSHSINGAHTGHMLYIQYDTAYIQYHTGYTNGAHPEYICGCVNLNLNSVSL